MPNVRRMGYLLVSVFAIVTVVSALWKPAAEAAFRGISDSQVPMSVGDYSGDDTPVDPETRAALPTACIIQRNFVGNDGTEIRVSVIGGTGRNELHDPRSCLLGAGWHISQDHVERLPGLNAQILARSCVADMSTTQTTGYDIMYLYVVDRKIVASASAIRWTLLKSDLLDQTDQAVYFVRALTPLPTPDMGAQARPLEHRHLALFMSALWQKLSPAIMEGEKA